MIINIRGTNGSGKTTLARQLIDESTACEVLLCGIVCTTDASARTVLIGPYIGRKTGGCDHLPTFEKMREVITAAALLYTNVVFEGVIISGVFKSWSDFDTVRGRDIVWAYLSTPVEDCVARVYARNGGKPFKEKNVTDKYEGTMVTRRKAMAAGHMVVDLPPDGADALARVREMLQ